MKNSTCKSVSKNDLVFSTKTIIAMYLTSTKEYSNYLGTMKYI